VADYTLKINEICDSLAWIDVNIDESEKVQICLGGLASKFRAFRTVVCTRETKPSFFDLQSMLLVEENHVGGAMSMHTDNKMLYMEERGPVGVEDEANRCAMEATDKEGTKEMPTAIPDPPEAGGVEASQPWIAGIVARKATGRASAGRSTPSRGEPRPDLDPDKLTEEIGSNCTTRKDPEKPEKPQPS
jgi:hypothetical protein